MNVILIFLGGGIGSVLRYLANITMRANTGNDFPYGILAINIIGSFLIGLTYSLIKKFEFASADHIGSFVMVGILGGFTTFSAFSLDVVTMINDGKAPLAFIYIAASVIFSLIACYLGLLIAR